MTVHLNFPVQKTKVLTVHMYMVFANNIMGRITTTAVQAVQAALI
jgi:hypothetical protein